MNVRIPTACRLISWAAFILAAAVPAVLAGQERTDLRPFAAAGLTTGDYGHWTASGGHSLRAESAWEVSLAATSYMEGLAGNFTFGLQLHTRPFLDDRAYFIAGPRMLWSGEPVWGFALGIGHPLSRQGLAAEVALHQAAVTQLSLGFRKRKV